MNTRREYNERYYAKHREAILLQKKGYYKAHYVPHPWPDISPEERKRRAAEATKRWRKTHPEKVKEQKLKWTAKNHARFPDKRKARSAVRDAIRRGKLTRSPVCLSCGKPCKTQGHHHNGYSKEAALDVVWLCTECHRLLHVF